MAASARPSPDQPDMFGVVAQPRKAPPPRPEFTEFPQSLARRLNADIRWLYPCQTLPWSEAELARRDRDFRACVEELHPDYRGDLLERWEAEIGRLTGRASNGS
jgi:hypothetical protein